MVIAALRTESEVKARCGIGTTVAIVTGDIKRNAKEYKVECKEL